MLIPPLDRLSSTLAGNWAGNDVYVLLTSTGGVAGSWQSLIGVVTAIVGNILISFALNTQRYAHVRLEKEQNREREGSSETPRFEAHVQEHDNEEEANETHPLISRRPSTDSNVSRDEKSTDQARQKSYLRSPYWWLGIALMVIGEAGNFLAYGFAPASIVSPLGVVALISNCLIAPIMLKEQFRKRDLLGVAIAVGGAVTIVLSAQGSNPRLGPGEILELIKRWEFLAYVGITVFLIIILMVLSNYRIAERTILVDLGVVGLLGGYTALSTKGVASLLSNGLWQVVTYPITYALVAVLVASAVLQIKYVNRALQRFDSTQVIPVQFVCFTISVIVGSAILYRDFESTTAEKVIQFVGGCALTFLGVWCITSGRGSTEEGEASQPMDEEQGIDMIDEEVADSRPTTPKANFHNSRQSSSLSSKLDSSSDSPSSFRTALSSNATPNPPRMLNTTSSPLLPTQARRYSAIQAASAEQNLSTAIPSHHTTPRPPTRSSRSSMLLPSPGPFTSPLSAGLSVVVADSRARMQAAGLRRGSSLKKPPGAISGSGSVNSTSGSGLRRSSAAADEGSTEAVMQRPRVGRGVTVEVAATLEHRSDRRGK